MEGGGTGGPASRRQSMGSNSCVLTKRVLLFCQVGKLSTADAVVTTVVVGRLGRLLRFGL